MKIKSERFIPLVVTVGQVAIFPYYIIWLKQVSLTFTLFAWLFAVFSFSAAWGYRVFQVKKTTKTAIPIVYIGMGMVYLLVGSMNETHGYLVYGAVLLQIILGFLQGYFRAWHVKQKSYHIQAVSHYLIVGFTMIGLSFVKVISPTVLITLFGSVLVGCGVWAFWKKEQGD